MLLKATMTPGALASLIVAFSGLGDAYLYVSLPLHAAELGVSVVWIGLLLSINRFVRLFANQLFVFLFGNFGFRRITLLCSVFSVLTTISYGLAPGIAILIVARVIWGICFSALRLASGVFALNSEKQGISLGIAKGLQETGAITALLVGPLLYHSGNARMTFLFLGMFSLPAIILACLLPDNSLRMSAPEAPQAFAIRRIYSGVNVMTGLSAFLVQGLLVINLSGFLGDSETTVSAIAVSVGSLLAYRRGCSVLLSPVAGTISDRLGIDRIHLWSTFFLAFGILCIVSGWPKSGILIAFAFEGISSAIAPGHSSLGKVDRLQAAAGNGTWNDMGAAIGVLTGGVLSGGAAVSQLLFFAAAVLFLVSCYYLFRPGSVLQEN